jgi:beta-glucosidase
MATINFGTTSPTEDTKPIDLKHASIHVQPVTLDTPSLTPAATPEEASPADETSMAGKKMFSEERPDDKARELAAKLTLEEQVRSF